MTLTRGPSLSNYNESYEIKRALDVIRSSVGDSEFGYRSQALFAHVLIELGYSISAINQKGHPDIKAEINKRIVCFQIKSISHNYAGCNLLINAKDLNGICPRTPSDLGYFAVLDCALPVSWVICDYEKIRKYELRSITLELIRAISDKNFSNESSVIFAELIAKSKSNLNLLTYSVLRKRALRNEKL